MKIAAIIPALNEEKNIEEVIRRLRSSLDCAIIIVDDGSTDRTAELARKQKVIVLSHKTNKGKGEALRTGFDFVRKKGFDYFLTVDSDLQFHPEEAGKLIKPLAEGKADFVMGARNWKTVPFRHMLGNFVWRTIFNFLFKTNLKDTNAGFIAFNKKAFEKINNVYGGYIIENSMLIRLIKSGMKIANVPVSVEYRRVSEVQRGIRMVAGILIFIIQEGIKYRLKVSEK